MSDDDDDFTPELGKPRAGGSRKGRTYLQRVLQARMLAGGSRRTGRSFNGTRIARGTVAGRQLAGRDRFAGFRQRRVMVKYRIAKFGKANGMGAARAHLRYIQRDGVTREGEPGQLYSAEHDRADGKTFLEQCEGDRHQFRFIVSPEDGQQYDDLQSLSRPVRSRSSNSRCRCRSLASFSPRHR